MVSPRAADVRLDPEAAEFVRFCYRRRSVGWPDLYDEMCAVASRRLFRGWDQAALGDHGVGFGLFELPALAALTAAIVAEEQAVRSAQRSARPDRRRCAPPDTLSAAEMTDDAPGRPPLAGMEDRTPGELDRLPSQAPATASAAATAAGPATDRSPEAIQVEALALAS